jgi:hypothetical protein
VRAAAVRVFVLAALLAGCGREDTAEQQQPVEQPVEQVQASDEPGVTPMAERVAVIGVLNKRNGIVRDLTMRPGQAVRLKDAVVRLRACERTAPWEEEKLTGAFLQLDVEGSDGQWRRVFSGWVYRESPSLNVVEHPVYDVWPKSCEMSFPAGPEPDSAPVASPREQPASRAQNSPGPPAFASAPDVAPEADTAPPDDVSPSAAASNSQ